MSPAGKAPPGSIRFTPAKYKALVHNNSKTKTTLQDLNYNLYQPSELYFIFYSHTATQFMKLLTAAVLCGNLERLISSINRTLSDRTLSIWTNHNKSFKFKTLSNDRLWTFICSRMMNVALQRDVHIHQKQTHGANAILQLFWQTKALNLQKMWAVHGAGPSEVS